MQPQKAQSDALSADFAEAAKKKEEEEVALSFSQRTLRARRFFVCSAHSAVAQGTVEYLLVLVAIVLAVLFAARANGPIQSAIDGVSSDASSVISTAVNDVKGRLGL